MLKMGNIFSSRAEAQHSEVKPNAVDIQQATATPEIQDVHSNTPVAIDPKNNPNTETTHRMEEKPEQAPHVDDQEDSEAQETTVVGKLLTEYQNTPLMTTVSEIVAERDLYVGLTADKG